MHAIARAQAITANQLFKDQYGRTLRWSAVGAVLVLMVGVLVMPEYQPVPYRLAQDAMVLEEFDILAPPVAEPPPREIRRPQPEVQIVPPDDPAVGELPDIPGQLIEVPFENPGWIEPRADTPYVVSAVKPRLIQGAVADYPEIARLAGLQGTVMVMVEVGVTGRVTRVEVLKGIHPLLDRPAMAAAKRLVFEPGRQEGLAVPCRVAVPFRFNLN